MSTYKLIQFSDKQKNEKHKFKKHESANQLISITNYN